MERKFLIATLVVACIGTVLAVSALFMHRKTNTAASYQTVAGPTVTETVTVTAAAAAANANGQATKISASGVYVVGKDIVGGTWHTSGDGGQTGSLCYFATLNSSNTNDIIDNNNFDGPETVSLSGVYALNINGPCTWTHE